MADFYSIADCSTTVRGIPIRSSGGYWARRQLHAGMKYVPTPSEFMELLCGLKRVPGGGWQELGALYIYK